MVQQGRPDDNMVHAHIHTHRHTHACAHMVILKWMVVFTQYNLDKYLPAK
jgi:hypothetical protein